MQQQALRGRCLCGGVRYRLEGELLSLCFCHCTSCRLAAGATPVAWGSVQLADFNLVAGDLRFVHSSQGVTRGFCADCGTSLTYAHGPRPEEIDVALATLTDPLPEFPRDHLWVQDKLPWVHVPADQPQYPGWRR